MNDTYQSHLEPCPFCGSTNIEHEGYGDCGGRTPTECRDCLATAIDDTAWNKRKHAELLPTQQTPEEKD